MTMGLTATCDLAEHLTYRLPANFDRHAALEPIEIFRAAFARMPAVTIDRGLSFDGLVWMLYDPIINPLPS
jgi:hypothetical protein